MKSTAKKDNWFAVIAVNLCVLFVLLFLAELVLQIMNYHELRKTRDSEIKERNVQFEYNLFLQTRPKPNSRDINRFGFRSPDIERAKKPGTVRIAMMGGSTTADFDNDYQNTYPAILVDMLKQQFPARQIEFINAGCDWYTSEHSIINYLFWVKDFHPDIVIFMHTINDLIRSFPADSYSDGTGFKEDYSHYYGYVSRFIKLNTEFLHYRFFSEFLLWKQAKEIFVKKTVAPKTFVEVNEFASLPSYKRNLQSLVSILHSDGVQLILVGEADLYRSDKKYQQTTWMNRLCKTRGRLPSYASLERGMELFNNELNMVADQNNIPIVRGDRLIPKEPRYLRDDVHLTAEGNRMLAEAILAVIKNNKTLSGYFTPPHLVP